MEPVSRTSSKDMHKNRDWLFKILLYNRIMIRKRMIVKHEAILAVAFLVMAAMAVAGSIGIHVLMAHAEASESVLKIEPGVQPESTLAPHDAESLAFTVVELTAVGTKDIRVKNMVIERKGLADDAAFAEVSISGTPLFMDELSLNAKHQYETKKSFVIKAGTTMELTLYGIMAADLTLYDGQKPSLALVRVDTDAKIGGTLPIVGTAHTVNSKVAIGTIAVSQGSRDPGTARTFAVGTKDATFTSVKADIGSQEGIKLTSVTWTQLGSMGAADLANLKTYVTYNGTTTSYDTIMDPGQKFWVATFGDGIAVPRGGTAEVFIKGDVVSGTNRTIQFELDAISLEGQGQTYGYMARNADVIAGSTHTIGLGSLLISGATQSQYHGEPLLGDIYLDVRGEAIEIHSFDLQLTSGGAANLKLWDSSGALAAGPANSSASGRVHFTNTWVAPIGRSAYHLTASSFGNFKNLFALTAKGVSTRQDIIVMDLTP